MRIAAAQMTSTPDKRANLAQARELLEQALDRGAEMIAFPENFSLLTDDRRQFFKEAETIKGPTVETLQEWAAENEIWIVGGSIPMKTPGAKKVTNTSLLISDEGVIQARYDKIHLFDVTVAGDRKYEESKSIRPGKKVVTANTPVGKAGLSICYDLRFPELYRRQSAAGAKLLFVPSAFTAVTGKAHWDVLTRARAIENQAYVIAPAQTGSPHPGRQTYGHTRIVDPWGRIRSERPAGVGIVWVDVNPDEIDRVRRELPALKHRKL
jgi:nitrilase